MEELGENGLRIYTFPTEDATVAEINNKMNVSMYIYVLYSHCRVENFGDYI